MMTKLVIANANEAIEQLLLSDDYDTTSTGRRLGLVMTDALGLLSTASGINFNGC